MIDSDALQVIVKLRKAGFQAYLVGGGVRDLLCKIPPKDFDISTSAKPEEIKHVFQRNCILIGKRFRLAHIRFGHKVIEVSTFRSGDNEAGNLILRDNCWGTPEEDALRRDFTINGLFYDPEEHVVIDYIGGWTDIHSRTLKTIGDPVARFRQDPVRMIRLLKFRARFGFEIDPKAKKALIQCREEIIKSAPARVLEEIFRMLESGFSASFFMLMQEAGILELLFPCLIHFLEGKFGDEVYRYLAAADKVNLSRQKGSLDRSLLVACLLYPVLEKEIEKQYTNKKQIPHMGDITLLTQSLMKAFVISSFSHFPHRISAMTTAILVNQYRLTPLSNKRHQKTIFTKHKDFGWSMQFLKLRSIVNPTLQTAYQSWKSAAQEVEKEKV